MRTGSLRYWAVPGVLALLAVGSVQAQDATPLPVAPRPAAPLPFPAASGGLPTALPGVEPLPQAGPAHPAGPVVGALPPSGDHQDEGYWFHGLYFTGDYLLLRPRRNALDYAIVSPTTTLTPGGTIESVDFHTESGFRLGAGFCLPGHDWSFGVTYMNFSSHGDAAAAAPAGGALYATLTSGLSYGQVGTARAFNNLDVNVLDFDLSHRFKVCDTFCVNVFGGGRFAWINQTLSAVYNGGPDNATNDKVDAPVYFNGAGLTVGAEGQWNFGHGVGLYARARGSLLSGQFRDYLTETAGNGSVAILDVNEKHEQVVPVAEMGLGVNYCSEHWHVSVGYELANWFDMVNSPDFQGASNFSKISRRTSDLSLEGLAVQLGLAF
jgi:hypothetical protein